MKQHPVYKDYFISQEGHVFRNGKQLKVGKHPQGYYVVTFCNQGKPKQFLVHRLVAEAFLPNPNNYSVVNHLDENKQNNNVSNLEWTTSQKNNEYSFSKYYIIENVKTKEQYSVFNLSQWCKKMDLDDATLGSTFHGKKNKTHKGFRIIHKSEIPIAC